MKLKYIIIYTLALIVLAFFSFESEAKQVKFGCDGFDVTLDQFENRPIVASITFEAGTWVEVPESGDSNTVYLFNIANSKLAIMGKSPQGHLFLQIYRDYDFYKAHQPQHSLRCLEKE